MEQIRRRGLQIYIPKFYVRVFFFCRDFVRVKNDNRTSRSEASGAEAPLCSPRSHTRLRTVIRLYGFPKTRGRSSPARPPTVGLEPQTLGWRLGATDRDGWRARWHSNGTVAADLTAHKRANNRTGSGRRGGRE